MKEKQTHNKHSFGKPENENISDEVKKIIEHHSAEYEQWAYRLKTNIGHTTAVMAVLLLAFVLYCVVPNPVSDAPLQPTATVAQQSRPPAVQHSEPVADTATMPTPKPAPTMQPAADRDCHAMYAAHKEPTAPTPVPDTIAAPPTMGPQPLLLAEAEPETKPEPNYNDNNYTDYLIADASIEIERQLTELQMYCSTRCSSVEVIVSLDRLMENTDIM